MAFVPGAPIEGADVDMAKVRERVQHVVVLMLENRSFDHLLGFLDHPHPDAFGQAGLAEHYNVDPHDPQKRHSAVKDGPPNGTDPDHSHAGIATQIGAFGGVDAMGGFVRNYEETKAGSGPEVMRCLTPETTCPVMAMLAKEFAVCTRWFSSVPGETWPNRNFAHAATSDRAVNIEFGFYVDTTIFERLEKAGHDWHIYFDGPPEVWFFKRLWRPRLRDLLPGRTPRLAKWYGMKRFFDHVANDALPAYSFIEPAHNHFFEDSDHPRQTNSQHCHNNFGDVSAADFRAGETLAASIYDALVARPDVFDKTLLLITYDEHGGLFDHVRPAEAVDPEDPQHIGLSRRLGRFARRVFEFVKRVPSSEEKISFDRYGVRVPAVLISPWIHPGRVVPDEFDHSSIPATLRSVFAPGAPFLTKRDEAARTFAGVVADAQALETPRRVAGDASSVPPLPLARDFIAPEPDVAVDAPPVVATPTAFDLRLARAGNRMQSELNRSKRVGVLRAMAVVPTGPSGEKAEPGSAEGAVADAGALTPAPSVDSSSPLGDFMDATQIARTGSAPAS